MNKLTIGLLIASGLAGMSVALLNGQATDSAYGSSRDLSSSRPVSRPSVSDLQRSAVPSVEKSAKAPLPSPSKKAIELEVDKNPHSAPQSLIDFARSMGKPMQAAIGNYSDAEMLLQKLSECALDREGSRTRTLKAYCFANAKIIAQAHSGLGGTVDALSEQADVDVVSLASKLNSK
jgi:hypothetical protein